MTYSKRIKSIWFIAIALMVLAADWGALSLKSSDPLGRWVAAGVAADWMIVIPAAYYFLIVRPGSRSLKKVIPVAALGYAAAFLILPIRELPLFRWFGYALIPFEIGLMLVEAYLLFAVARRLLAVGHRSGHVVDHVKEALFEAAGKRTIASMLVHEFSVVYYTLCSWGKKPFVPEGSVSFSVTEKSSLMLWTVVLIKVTLLEGTAVHFLIAGWSDIAAWVLTGLHVLFLIWAIANMRASILNPVLLTRHGIRIRYGLILDADIAFASVAGVTASKQFELSKEERKFAAEPLFDTPNVRIELAAPARVRYLFGMFRDVRTIYLFIDEPERFVAECRHSLTSAF